MEEVEFQKHEEPVMNPPYNICSLNRLQMIRKQY